MASRYGELLKPIRDLTENWNIDLAAYLEDYLAELENIVITFDGGETTMNFAEAALLIQGFACVYSKKVEFLYNLVVNMLNLLQTNKQTQDNNELSDEQKKKRRKETKDGDNDFVSMDDIEIGKNLDLKDPCKFSISYLKRMPMCFFGFGVKDLNEPKLYTKDGEVLGKRSDFKMTSVEYTDDGFAILPGFPFPVEEEQKYQEERIEIAPSPLDEKEVEAPSSPSACDAMDHDGGGDVSDFIYDDPPAAVLSRDEKGDGSNIKDCDSVQVNNKDGIKLLFVLDSYDEIQANEKAFKSGRVTRLPAELATLTNGAKRASKRKKLESVMAFCNNKLFSNKSKYPKGQLKVPSEDDCDARFWKEHKQRALNKENQKRAAKLAVDEPAEEDDDDDGDDNSPLTLDDQSSEEVSEVSVKAACRAADLNFDDSLIKTTYEELVKNYMDGCLSSKHMEYLSETGQRVKDWEQRITPFLEEEANREGFDIHVYGSKVLSSFAGNNRKQTISFHEIAAGKPTCETARLFAASLQLANGYNIEITKAGSFPEGDVIDFTLLSRTRHHEQLDEYVAPSTHKS